MMVGDWAEYSAKTSIPATKAISRMIWLASWVPCATISDGSAIRTATIMARKAAPATCDITAQSLFNLACRDTMPRLCPNLIPHSMAVCLNYVSILPCFEPVLKKLVGLFAHVARWRGRLVRYCINIQGGYGRECARN